MPENPPVSRIRMRLAPAAEKAVRGGHPWIFADSVRDQNREGSAGEIAVMYTRDDRFLGFGLYDPGSPLRVRVLHTGKPANADDAWWRARMEDAVGRREGILNAETNGCRLINGESDGWPGLVLDRYAETVVLKVYTAAWFPHLPRVIGLIREVVAPRGIVLRHSRNIVSDVERAGYQQGVLWGETPATVVFRENGLQFEAEVLHGQKTGFFLDQRDNRQRAGKLTRQGKEVLNAFSFSGGFSLYAARAGAASVTDVDISAHALAAGDRNFALNQDIPEVARCRREKVCADAFDWLAEGPRGQFDLVIVDPPSLAVRESARAGAVKAYEKLAASALRRVRPGGVLMAASCSAHVSAEEFYGAVARAALPYRTQVLWTSGHAPDHAVTFREASYLKCMALLCR